MPGKGISQKIQDFHYLIEQTRPLLAEVPYFATPHGALEELLQRVEALFARAEAGKAEKLEANRMRKEAIAEAAEARARLAAALQSHFGTKSEKLIIYGINPRPRTINRATKAEKELAALKAVREEEGREESEAA
jgi:hypothetical protein